VTVEQTLAGAMGAASFRVRERMREYAAGVSPTSGLAASSPQASGSISALSKGLDPWSVDERGLTDLVMSTLWWFGPSRAEHVSCLAVTQSGESKATGADVAFVDVASHRILVYQSKVAYRHSDGVRFELKNAVKAHHPVLLGKTQLDFNGTSHGFEGRLALYNTAPASESDESDFEPWYWSGDLFGLRRRLWHSALLTNYSNDPRLGQDLYTQALVRGSWSARGVLAARLPALDPITRRHLSISATWPCEWDFYAWALRRSIWSPNGDLDRAVLSDLFNQYEQGFVEGPSADEAADVARRLGASRLFTNRNLSVIVFRGLQ
jgi:hypothetical protein